MARARRQLPERRQHEGPLVEARVRAARGRLVEAAASPKSSRSRSRVRASSRTPLRTRPAARSSASSRASSARGASARLEARHRVQVRALPGRARRAPSRRATSSATTVTPGVARRPASAPPSCASRSPRFEPRATNARTGGRLSILRPARPAHACAASAARSAPRLERAGAARRPRALVAAQRALEGRSARAPAKGALRTGQSRIAQPGHWRGRHGSKCTITSPGPLGRAEHRPRGRGR